tara:strand:+ start:7020 stop:7721 length:702 start_codon:yes stop_codon:yes gene_type:complete
MATHHNTPVLYSGYASGYKDLREMPMSINPDYYCLEDDFVYELDTGWVVVKDSGASVAIVADTIGGELAITSTATTDNDGGSVQGNEIFAVAADKNMFFQTRIKNNDVDQTDICVGFTVNFATNPEAMLTATDRIVFQVNDGDASILCKTEKDGTETSTDSGIDMADNTYVKLGIACSGTGKVEFFINDRLVATHSTNIPDDENLAMAAMSVSGSASGTRATTIDYLMGARTR